MGSSRPAAPLLGYVALSLVWLAILGGALLLTRQPAPQPIEILPPPSPAPATSAAPTPTAGPLWVDVAGAVQRPGVYALALGSIVADALEAAGGAAPDADLDRLNKAQRLEDGMQVYVPRAGETAATAIPIPVRAGSTQPGAPINVNTATAAELESLPGIGPTLAQAVIAGRPYRTVEDLLRVPGIGEATLEKLHRHVTVD